MKKLLVVDFYNTLINYEDAITTRTMLEIDKLRQQGVKLCIITNRLLDDVLYYNESFPFIDYIISLNGGVAYDISSNKFLYGKKLDDKMLNKIETKYNNYEITYYSDNNKSNNIIDNIYKVEVKLNKKDLKNIDYFKYPVLKIDNNYYLEISNNNSYDMFSKMFSINKNDIVGVIGNISNYKFVEELDSYVMSNAFKELKNISKKKTKSNNHNGVLNVLKKEFK